MKTEPQSFHFKARLKINVYFSQTVSTAVEQSDCLKMYATYIIKNHKTHITTNSDVYITLHPESNVLYTSCCLDLMTSQWWGQIRLEKIKENEGWVLKHVAACD